jgi:hypothetical protein
MHELHITPCRDVSCCLEVSLFDNMATLQISLQVSRCNPNVSVLHMQENMNTSLSNESGSVQQYYYKIK